MVDVPEKIGRYEGYGPDDIRYTQPPLSIAGQTNYIRADLVDELVKAAERFNRGGITLFGNEEDVPITFKGKDFQALRAALTRIKGDGK